MISNFAHVVLKGGVKKTRTSPSESKKPTQPKNEKIKIKLADGKEQEVTVVSSEELMIDGKLVKKEDYRKSLLKQLQLPDTFKTQRELQSLWANPTKRVELLKRLEDEGFDKKNLDGLQKIFQAEDSDLLDVLAYIVYARIPLSRTERVRSAENKIYASLTQKQKEFAEFALNHYIRGGFEELNIKGLSKILEIKYGDLPSARENLGSQDAIRRVFIDLQEQLYMSDKRQ